MLRLRSSKSRPEITSHGPAPNPTRSVRFQHINPHDAHRDAHIAASKAFVQGHERSSSEISETFPETLPKYLPKNSTADIQRRQSIRFVHTAPTAHITTKTGEDNLGSALCSPDAARLAPVWTASRTLSSLRGSSFDHDDEDSQFTSTNNAWSGVMQHNKENLPGGDASPANQVNRPVCANVNRLHHQSYMPIIRTRSTVQPSRCSSSSLRQQTTASLGRGVKYTTDSHATCTSHPESHTESCVKECSGSIFTEKEKQQEQPCSEVPRAFSETSFPASNGFRFHRRNNFSFSSHDDEQIATLSRSTPPHAAQSSRLQYQPGVRIRKSLRKGNLSTGNMRPLAPKPVVAEKPDMSKDTPPPQTGGSLRKTASKMGKAVKRLRELWGHSNKSEDDAVPNQHIWSQKSHGSFVLDDAGNLVWHAADTSSHPEDGGSVVRAGRLDSENGTTPRFTSWSSSVRRSSAATSQQAQTAEYGHPQLSAIAESSNHLLVPPTDHRGLGMRRLHSFENTASMYKAQASGFPTIMPVRSQSDLVPVLVVRPQSARMASQQSSATSSPSLAGSGRDKPPRPVIAPETLKRLQELSLGLQQACASRTKPAAAGADPFYDGATKNSLFAFPSTPTTPVPVANREHARALPLTPTSAGKEEPFTPQFLFRGNSAYRRALRQSMKLSENMAPTGQRNISTNSQYEEDAPLLHPHSARQWSRVQA